MSVLALLLVPALLLLLLPSPVTLQHPSQLIQLLYHSPKCCATYRSHNGNNRNYDNERILVFSSTLHAVIKMIPCCHSLRSIILRLRLSPVCIPAILLPRIGPAEILGLISIGTSKILILRRISIEASLILRLIPIRISIISR